MFGWPTWLNLGEKKGFEGEEPDKMKPKKGDSTVSTWVLEALQGPAALSDWSRSVD